MCRLVKRRFVALHPAQACPGPAETRRKTLVSDYLKPTVPTYLLLSRGQLLIDSNWIKASALAADYLVKR